MAMANGRCRFHGGVVRLRSPEGVRRAVEASARHYAAWRASMGLPPWWRVRLVGMSAAEWLAKHGKQEPEAEGEPSELPSASHKPRGRQ
jgi:hypothetical protein